MRYQIERLWRGGHVPIYQHGDLAWIKAMWRWMGHRYRWRGLHRVVDTRTGNSSSYASSYVG